MTAPCLSSCVAKTQNQDKQYIPKSNQDKQYIPISNEDKQYIPKSKSAKISQR
jgi:hypothetical protein